MLAFLAGAAGPIIALLYGPQWEATAPLVRVLCAAGALTATMPFFGEVLLAMGRADAQLRAQVMCASLRVSTVVAIAIATAGLPFGLLAVTLGMFASAAFDLAMSYMFLQCTIRLHWRDLLGSAGRSLAVTMLSSVGPTCVGLSAATLDFTPFVAVLLATVTAGLGWFAGIALFRHPLRDEIRSVARHFLGSRAS